MNTDTAGGEALEAREWLVEGRVQGVGFRAATRRRAGEVGVRCLAENLTDGRVRVLGLGRADALGQLGAWLRHGPSAARVDALEEREAQAEALESALEGERSGRR